jgi:hypothetical protein
VAEAAVVARLLSLPLNPLFLLSLSALPVLGDNFFFVSLIPLRSVRFGVRGALGFVFIRQKTSHFGCGKFITFCRYLKPSFNLIMQGLGSARSVLTIVITLVLLCLFHELVAPVSA